MANASTFYCYRTPHGPLTIRADRTGVTDVVLGESPLDGQCRPSEITNRAATQIMEYLAGKRHVFDVPLSPQGTAFQKRVWDEIDRIPYGSAATCAQIARQLGNEEGFRAVGAAVRKNPLVILIPAHRVTSADGKPLGSGRSADLKAALLRLEQENLKNGSSSR